jgi:unsaturated rhamnogalacturonyl hydrolase
MNNTTRIPTKLVKAALISAVMILLFTRCETGNRKLSSVTAHSSWHEWMLDSEMNRNPKAWMLDFEKKPKWNYTHGLVLMAAYKTWEVTGNQQYLDYINAYYDEMIEPEGVVHFNYRLDNFNIDHIKPGINLFDLYKHTREERYLKAIHFLRDQLKTHPRTSGGGFWHKGMYPQQLWLDGVYMNTPFYTRYGVEFNEPENFDDVLLQIREVGDKTRDPKTGLLYHAYDAAGEQPWANLQTGHSPNFWGRAMGWYMMALVDVLDYFPMQHPGRGEIITILSNLTDALLAYQYPENGLWYQVVDQPEREGNYPEASVSSMVAYTITKAVNNHYLDASYMEHARKAFQGILDHLVTIDEDGLINLNNVCGVAGLGGNPYRDGSYEYYINEIIRSNDPKGVGPFILLSLEMQKAGLQFEKQF